MKLFAIGTALASAIMFAGVWIVAGPADPVVAAVAGSTAVDAASPSATQPMPSVQYAGCRDVRAAGKAPLLRDQPGYRPDMDGDGDGIACEPRPHDPGDAGVPIL